MSPLHSQILGQGQPLLVLHGFLGMSDNWKSHGLQWAKEGFEVHLIDQRNHGRSFHSEEFDYRVMSRDLNEYIQQQELKNVYLLGHSMGGKTVMNYACDFAGQVTKLLVADIAPKYYPAHHGYIFDALNSLDFSKISSRGEADKALAKHLSDWGMRQFLLKNLYWIEPGKLAFRFNLEVLGNRLEEIGEPLSSQQQYDGPTLFLRGDRSEYIVEADLSLIQQHFSEVEIKTIANAGHWLHAENPKDFFKTSLTFFKE
ncbi:alpha/beta fold hydrolase [Aureicoccus marinus]|uniref:Alpha/beta hydrolase n=1 Tax=Aureicoccus marinus TaxID=754435 RepID=A0A2S7T863_9FLAO|nr:alpha/beta fold hydrolase [Aureicoccus marinus]PQJ15758.1 alpha/beta hydrolase [Aureicoccus marinus]